MSRLSLNQLRKMKAEHNKIAVLTAYDATFSHVLEQAGVDIVLVGDSLGMVIQGQESTLPVTVDHMVYHTANVIRGSESLFVITDMPFMSYANIDQAMHNAARLMAEGGAQMIKLEGGAEQVELISALTRRGIPVCGHLGLLPQSVHKLGGYLVQGREQAAADKILQDAISLEKAGADMLVLECVPATLAKLISEALTIPVIGIGAGADCDGQVLVLYDMLGITPGKRPRFSHDFLADCGHIPAAISRYVEAVKNGKFPTAEQQY
ncbi:MULTISPECIES: 3-methyl-2-oxobutanoate hydroxymethyltransferase [unclassified Methylophaga]|mgnify:FL=1|uniref:3-methyl-2-oxobutanoate hydroxymethyltransferase n=1 Tax=unclassified Methylophaga TaxID=2629249 RepID=UPI000C917008|nr:MULTISPECIES: 3-methyl-2-oxobutanoate hydroxymethyltransferase [unclassified Methylophaga]MBN47472.1 3-methyl-2-oxobutanoate hydroxymethyltransferase [Methylophaga sp.]|tara:strand:+ start:19440 stop:20234 length:795 start_codon:yes stop_codon:yes gene_type:complete